jgi:hypothetical protein
MSFWVANNFLGVLSNNILGRDMAMIPFEEKVPGH